jgi:hypothetical protein
MKVEGNILPVDLRIEEIAVREIAKIQSKNIAEPVKQLTIANESRNAVSTELKEKLTSLGIEVDMS